MTALLDPDVRIARASLHGSIERAISEVSHHRVPFT
jgi:hypothetical protein